MNRKKTRRRTKAHSVVTITLDDLTIRAKKAKTPADADAILTDIYNFHVNIVSHALNKARRTAIKDIIKDLTPLSVTPLRRSTPLINLLDRAMDISTDNQRLFSFQLLISMFEKLTYNRLRNTGNDTFLPLYYVRTFELLSIRTLRKMFITKIKQEVFEKALRGLVSSCLIHQPELASQCLAILPIRPYSWFLNAENLNAEHPDIYRIKQLAVWQLLDAIRPSRSSEAFIVWAISNRTVAPGATTNVAKVRNILALITSYVTRCWPIRSRTATAYIYPCVAQIPSFFFRGKKSFVKRNRFHKPACGPDTKGPQDTLIDAITLLFFPTEEVNPQKEPTANPHLLLTLCERILQHHRKQAGFIQPVIRKIVTDDHIAGCTKGFSDLNKLRFEKLVAEFSESPRM